MYFVCYLSEYYLAYTKNLNSHLPLPQQIPPRKRYAIIKAANMMSKLSNRTKAILCILLGVGVLILPQIVKMQALNLITGAVAMMLVLFGLMFWLKK